MRDALLVNVRWEGRNVDGAAGRVERGFEEELTDAVAEGGRLGWAVVGTDVIVDLGPGLVEED